MSKCIDEEGHDFEFIGYMVVSPELPKEEIILSTPPRGSTLWGYPVFRVPLYFPAKVEVHQCKKCGEIKLQQAVFSRI